MNDQILAELRRGAPPLVDAVQRLRAALRPPVSESVANGLANMLKRAEEYRTDLNDPARCDLHDSSQRHDLRAHLSLIHGYADLWKRHADKFGLNSKVSNLTDVLSYARGALDLFEKGVGTPAAQVAQTPSTGYLPPHNLPSEVGNLLVVDDRAENRELLKTLLEQQGHTVLAVASGKEALAMLSQGSIDLVLLDVMMPEMDGFEVLEQIKGHPTWRHIPVVMVSSSDKFDRVVASIARGAEDYLIRPPNELLLRARVGACLEKKRLADRELEHLAQIDQVLHAIFPPEVVAELKTKRTIRPRRHDKVGVCFVDVVGFTSYCDRHEDDPELVVRNLEWYVKTFEATARKHGVEKIKTIGDAFLMVSNLLRPVDGPVWQLVKCAVELLEAIRSGPAGWQVRVGIHVGPVVAGTLGEMRYSFDLWGSTVNVAARMESGGLANRITLSDAAWLEVADRCLGQPRPMAVRGIGPMTVWEFERFR